MSEYTPETLRTDAEKKAIPYFARLRMRAHADAWEKREGRIEALEHALLDAETYRVGALAEVCLRDEHCAAEVTVVCDELDKSGYLRQLVEARAAVLAAEKKKP